MLHFCKQFLFFVMIYLNQRLLRILLVVNHSLSGWRNCGLPMSLLKSDEKIKTALLIPNEAKGGEFLSSWASNPQHPSSVSMTTAASLSLRKWVAWKAAAASVAAVTTIVFFVHVSSHAFAGKLPTKSHFNLGF